MPDNLMEFMPMLKEKLRVERERGTEGGGERGGDKENGTGRSRYVNTSQCL